MLRFVEICFKKASKQLKTCSQHAPSPKIFLKSLSIPFFKNRLKQRFFLTVRKPMKSVPFSGTAPLYSWVAWRSLCSHRWFRIGSGHAPCPRNVCGMSRKHKFNITKYLDTIYPLEYYRFEVKLFLCPLKNVATEQCRNETKAY